MTALNTVLTKPGLEIRFWEVDSCLHCPANADTIERAPVNLTASTPGLYVAPELDLVGSSQMESRRATGMRPHKSLSLKESC
jgi:hypothetical protein